MARHTGKNLVTTFCYQLSLILNCENHLPSCKNAKAEKFKTNQNGVKKLLLAVCTVYFCYVPCHHH